MRSFPDSLADGAPFKFLPAHQYMEGKGLSKVWKVNLKKGYVGMAKPG